MITARQLAAITARRGGPAKPRGARKKKPKPPAAARPHQCVILAIDPGAASGWALFFRGRLAQSGVAKWRDLREVIVTNAYRRAAEICLPLVVVGEKWTGVWRHGQSALQGLAEEWATWKFAALDAGVPKRRIVRVATSTWRAALIGGRQRPTEEWKAAAKAVVRARYDLSVLGDDEADAILIGAWACHAGEVAKVLPRRTR